MRAMRLHATWHALLHHGVVGSVGWLVVLDARACASCSACVRMLRACIPAGSVYAGKQAHVPRQSASAASARTAHRCRSPIATPNLCVRRSGGPRVQSAKKPKCFLPPHNQRSPQTVRATDTDNNDNTNNCKHNTVDTLTRTTYIHTSHTQPTNMHRHARPYHTHQPSYLIFFLSSRGI